MVIHPDHISDFQKESQEKKGERNMLATAFAALLAFALLAASIWGTCERYVFPSKKNKMNPSQVVKCNEKRNEWTDQHSD